MNADAQAKALVEELKPLFKTIPQMVLEIQRESKRERKKMMDERSRKMNKEI
jgi:hypothetical protein